MKFIIKSYKLSRILLCANDYSAAGYKTSKFERYHWARFTISGLTHPFTMMKKFRFSITFNRAWEHQQALGYYSLYTPLQRGLGAPQLILSALGLRPV